METRTECETHRVGPEAPRPLGDRNGRPNFPNTKTLISTPTLTSLGVAYTIDSSVEGTDYNFRWGAGLVGRVLFSRLFERWCSDIFGGEYESETRNCGNLGDLALRYDLSRTQHTEVH